MEGRGPRALVPMGCNCGDSGDGCGGGVIAEIADIPEKVVSHLQTRES